MKFPFKAIAIGLLVGAAIFFTPFHFPFFLLFLIFFFGRFLFSPWGRRGYGWRHRGWDDNQVIPIDGYGNNAAYKNQGPEQKINVQ